MVLYRHIRLDKNEVFYIGIGADMKRPYVKSGRNKQWRNIVAKTDYRVEILFDDIETWEKACEKEKEFIKLYGRRDLGLGTLVNMTDGGEGSLGGNKTPETREKISRSSKGKKKSDDFKKKITRVKKGNKNCQGKTWKIKTKRPAFKMSEEQKKKISDSHKGKELCDEHKEKLSNSIKEWWIKRKQSQSV